MIEKHPTATTKSYVLGFAYSLILTVTAYCLVVYEVLSGWTVAFTILALAVLQLSIQLFYFLHLDQEKKPRWNMVSFFFAVQTVLIVVLGSVWIMVNLNYHHAHKRTPEQVEKYIQEQEAIEKKDLR
ncbi:MAG TPA: cytochrome o ubiquinol oxidase subunit IV [Candidatus Saccharimonadales bacterium]|nr:cytochrome o ubiquinol oxidase subunit IV [Candidatus Saccharimonadales bacterium]